MKRHKQLRQAWLILALLSLFISAPASATSYDCDGGQNPVPANVSGSVEITSSGDCTIGHNVTATGSISIIASTVTIQGLTTPANVDINATANTTGTIVANDTISAAYIMLFGSSVDVQEIQTTSDVNIYVGNGIKSKALTSTAGGVFLLSQTAGAIEIGGAINTSRYVYAVAYDSIKIDGDITSATDGGISLKAGGELSTKNITGSPTGNIDIKAHTREGTTPFQIGGTNDTNGINGTVTSHATIYITNGTSDSQANINLLDPQKLVISNGVNGGYIILNAQQGTLNMPSGILAVDGDPAGQIQLMAKTVAFDSGATLSTVHSGSAGHLHGIAIAAETITYKGAGLNLIADGDGSNPAGAFIYLMANGATTVNDSGDIFNPTIGVVNSDEIPQALNLQGDGTAPLKLSANGDHALVLVTAYPISFSGGPVTLESKGKVDHSVYLQNNVDPGMFSGLSPGISFSNTAGTGLVKIDVSGDGGNGGAVDILSDQALIDATSFEIKADGPTSGNGNGGTVHFSSGAFSMTPSSTASISANAALAGEGDASDAAIKFFPGKATVALGSGPGKLKLAAKGGNTSGNGGTIHVYPDEGNISLSTAQNQDVPVDVRVLGTTGNGGSIYLSSNNQIEFTGDNSVLIADGGIVSGDGGKIFLQSKGTIEIDSLANSSSDPLSHSVTLSAKSLGAANTSSNKGGTIEIANSATVTIVNGGLAVDVGGDATGGIINIHDNEQVTIAGTLRADGMGSGKAGSVIITATTMNPMTLDGATISASGEIDGTGSGNEIIITNVGPISMNNTTLEANGGGEGGDAGTILVTVDESTSPIDLTEAHIEATVFPGNALGKGGHVQINKATGTLTSTDPTVGINVPIVIKVDGGSDLSTTDIDGSISLNNVTCQQWKTAAAIYPKTGWDCITPTTGDNISALISAGASLPSTIKGQLANLISPAPANPTVGLYAMVKLRDFYKFFGRPQVAPYDSQFGRSNISWLRVSAAFALSEGAQGGLVPNTILSDSPSILEGALVHELGHHLDYIWGPGLTLLSAQTEWANLLALDFTDMDELPCISVFFQSTCDGNQGEINSHIFDIRFSGIGHDFGELFAAIHEHIQSSQTGNPLLYQVDPELEKALNAMTRGNAAMSSWVNNPPPAVK